MNNKIDWKRKLSSRKFWAAIVGLVTALLTAFKFDEAVAVQVTSVIMAFGTLIAYIFAEGFIDGKREEGNITNIINTEELKESKE
ncbi:hypothetical protein [Anaerosphaera multitolerans]|uniref:Holin n=1 Tax=Anaerosphaera multitolerans TaxID=2487351 RepID=A0A437S455_9FIRM|nr:hypothetical protein [Anaerosphaera multitolerans]RVU53815.1 hypothetical protein EF514_10570 [Anaerosphaera multitolerans]